MKTIEVEARQLVTDTRRLVHGLVPPVVEEVGLVEAIRQHADRLNRTADRQGTFRLQADCDGINGLPAVGIAAYIIATEAMTNVARHPRARSCTVAVTQNSRLHIEVVDDGVGIGPAPRSGVGLHSMQERTDELGGALIIEPVDPRGTRVAGRWAEQVYDIRRWTEMPSGGHFAALEEPEALAEDVRAFFRDLR